MQVEFNYPNENLTRAPWEGPAGWGSAAVGRGSCDVTQKLSTIAPLLHGG